MILRRFAFLLLMILLAEGILTLFCFSSKKVDHLLAFNGGIPFLIPDAKLGRRPNPDYFEHDSAGFRNESRPRQAPVVVLGDSQTYGFDVPRKDSWPAQWAQKRGETIYNMGVGGYGPTHALMLFEEALSLQPGLILFAFYSGNDLFDSYRHVYNKGQFPEFKSTSPEILKKLQKLDQIQSLETEITFANQTASLKGSENPVRQFLARYSKLYGLQRAFKRRLDRQNPARLYQASPPWSDFRKQAQKHAADLKIFESGRLKTIFTPTYRLTALNLEDPRIAEGLRISQEAMRELAAKAQKAGVHFKVVLIPSKELAYRKTVIASGNPESKSYKRLTDFEERALDSIREYLKSQNISFIDLLPQLQKLIAEGQQLYPESWDGHPTAAGHAAVADWMERSIGEER